ncbi:MAG: carbohydrate kinase [Gammaproteobacteria bacterium]|nr:carbohydrate kinase [Gammaproteobacteria bacterium]
MSQAKLLIFGEVLFDCFADGSRVMGGAPFNVAWHCQAFGLNPLLISRIGSDEMGGEILTAMHQWGMQTSGLQHDAEHSTGMVDVSIEDGSPCYDIVENSAWDFINQQALPQIDKDSVLYHGSLALRNTVSAQCLAAIKKQCGGSVFVDVNLRDPWWQRQHINSVIHGASWLKINDEELDLIVAHENDIESKARFLFTSEKLKLIIVTKGAAGAIAISDNEMLSVKPETTVNVNDTVGAGDAFCSVMLLGIDKGWSLKDTLIRAQQFASAVVGLRGATTGDMEFYLPFIKNWALE